MGDLYDLGRLVDRDVYQGGPDTEPGIRLNRGYLPTKRFGSLVYAHVHEIVNGEIIPSSEDAIDRGSGKMLLPGEIVVVEVTDPDEVVVVKHVGSAILGESGICYDPKPTL